MAKGLKSIGFPSLVFRLLLSGEKVNCDRPWKSFFFLNYIEGWLSAVDGKKL